MGIYCIGVMWELYFETSKLRAEGHDQPRSVFTPHVWWL